MKTVPRVPLLTHAQVVFKDFILRQNLNVLLVQNTAEMVMFAIVQTVIVKKGVKTHGLENGVLAGALKDAPSAVRLILIPVLFVKLGNMVLVANIIAAQDVYLEVQIQNKYATKRLAFVSFGV